jgi:hypothetical protein
MQALNPSSLYFGPTTADCIRRQYLNLPYETENSTYEAYVRTQGNRGKWNKEATNKYYNLNSGNQNGEPLATTVFAKALMDVQLHAHIARPILSYNDLPINKMRNGSQMIGSGQDFTMFADNATQKVPFYNYDPATGTFTTGPGGSGDKGSTNLPYGASNTKSVQDPFSSKYLQKLQQQTLAMQQNLAVKAMPKTAAGTQGLTRMGKSKKMRQKEFIEFFGDAINGLDKHNYEDYQKQLSDESKMDFDPLTNLPKKRKTELGKVHDFMDKVASGMALQREDMLEQTNLLMGIQHGIQNALDNQYEANMQINTPQPEDTEELRPEIEDLLRIVAEHAEIPNYRQLELIRQILKEMDTYGIMDPYIHERLFNLDYVSEELQSIRELMDRFDNFFNDKVLAEIKEYFNNKALNNLQAWNHPFNSAGQRRANAELFNTYLSDQNSPVNMEVPYQYSPMTPYTPPIVNTSRNSTVDSTRSRQAKQSGGLLVSRKRSKSYGDDSDSPIGFASMPSILNSKVQNLASKFNKASAPVFPRQTQPRTVKGKKPAKYRDYVGTGLTPEK